MRRFAFTAKYALLLLCLLLTCCAQDIPDIPDPLTEEEFSNVNLRIEIIDPADGDLVDRSVTVKVTYEGVSAGQHIWACVHSYWECDDLWYLQDTAPINADGTWEVLCLFGREGLDQGASFYIGIILVDDDRHEELIKEIEKAGGNSIPLSEKILARITVKRK